MQALRNLFSGRYPLWCVFWILGLPVFAVFDVTAGCAIADKCSYVDATQRNFFSLWVLIATAGIGVLLTSVPIWRSSTNYTGPLWVAVLAKLYVCCTVPVAGLMSLAAISTLAYHAVTGRWS